MQIYKKIRDKAEKYSGFFLIALPAAIMLLYLVCERIHDLDDVLYYLYPALIKSLMILLVYLAWRCYTKENVPVIVSILLCGFAAALPLVRGKHWWAVGGDYWRCVIFLCLPILLLFIIKLSEKYITESRPHCMQKRSLLYFLAVLLLIYLTANIGLYYETGSWRYDIADGLYLLLLSDILFWKVLYAKPEQAGSRIRGAVFMAVINAGVCIFLLIENPRQREVLSYIRDSLAGGSRTASQVDWTGYRRAALEAFLSGDLTVLDHTYRKEKYMYSVYGDGLTAIRFRCGMMPVLVMALLLVLLVIFLWNWNREDAFLNQCARCLAAGYILKMCIVLILQSNMIVLPFMEFPFTGRDMAEIMPPMLLVYERYCRQKKTRT